MNSVVRILLLGLLPSLAYAARLEETEDSSNCSNSHNLLYHELAQDKLTAVLVGRWETDYHSLVGDTRVIIKQVDPAKVAQYMRGYLAKLPNFEAESSKFENNGVNGKRLLTITKMLPFTDQPKTVLAEIEQRLDGAHPVLHRGTLYLEHHSDGLRWVLEWEHSEWFSSSKRRWWRYVDRGEDGEKSLPENGDNQQQAKRLGESLFSAWETECDRELGYRAPFKAQSSFTLWVGVGVRHGLAGSTLTLDLNYDEDQVYEQRTHIQCWFGKAAGYSSGVATHSWIVGEVESMGRDLASFFKNITSYRDPECKPFLQLSFGFTVVPYPPFLWPIPFICPSIGFALPFRNITRCLAHVGSQEIAEKAHSARPEGEEAAKLSSEASEQLDEEDKPKKDAEVAEQHGEEEKPKKERNLALTADFSQGFSFTFLPPALGWWRARDLTLIMNMRKLLKGVRRFRWRKSKLEEVVSECDQDRDDVFRRLVAWSKSANALLNDKSEACRPVLDTLAEISAEHPEATLASHQLALVPYVQQLSDDNYKRLNGTKEISLAGGTVYLGTDGFSVGMTVYAPGGSSKDYQHPCKAFAAFVNQYHTEVLPELHDVKDRLDCSVDAASLTSMDPGSCSPLQDIPSTLPRYPTLYVDNVLNIIEATDSACTRCMAQRTFGMPCRFCAQEKGVTCSSFFSSSGGLFSDKCGTTVEVPLRSLDRPSRTGADPRFWCAVAGGAVLYRGQAGETELDMEAKDLLRDLARQEA